METENSVRKIAKTSILGKLPDPQTIDEIKPTIYFDRKSINNYSANYIVNPKALINKLNELNLLAVKRIVFITHGFTSDGSTNWIQHMRYSLQCQSDLTVAVVDWKDGAKKEILPIYSRAAANSILVGKWLSKILVEIREHNKGINIYCVGHSLCAHLMGSAGREANTLLHPLTVIDRITGLDPAGYRFEDEVNKLNRLSKTNAKFVDVIHTDGWAPLLQPYFGTLSPLGSIDFYPNMGYKQKLISGDIAVNDERSVSNLQSNNLYASGDSDINVDLVGFQSSEEMGSLVELKQVKFLNLAYSHSRAIDQFIWRIGNKDAFNTATVFDKVPNFAHKSDLTFNSGFMVQMGYYADTYQDDIQKLPKTWYNVRVTEDIPQYSELSLKN